MRSMRSYTGILFVAMGLAAAAVLLSGAAGDASASAGKGSIQSIGSVEELRSVVENSGDRLLVFDLYADWCMPCKILSPRLEKIAKEHGEKATIYKINVDKNPGIAGAFGVRGIPYVVFVREKAAVHAMTGVQPPEAYIQAIDRFSKAAAPEKS